MISIKGYEMFLYRLFGGSYNMEQIKKMKNYPGLDTNQKGEIRYLSHPV